LLIIAQLLPIETRVNVEDPIRKLVAAAVHASQELLFAQILAVVLANRKLILYILFHFLNCFLILNYYLLYSVKTFVVLDGIIAEFLKTLALLSKEFVGVEVVEG